MGKIKPILRCFRLNYNLHEIALMMKQKKKPPTSDSHRQYIEYTVKGHA